jgi:hypothetical protein
VFEITGNDISSLSDGDLRCLVARLAAAELRAKGQPISSITAGGNQDAADGGLDVRINCSTEIANPDFVPRRFTGFQVKKPEMRSAAISKEMRPKGVLRDVIRELAEGSGAYIIVSGRASVTDTGLAARRQAIREALSDLSCAAQLHTDFYDRDRIATWVNQYPGIAVWVRRAIGHPLSGWSGIGDWECRGRGNLKPYLLDNNACLIDESSRDNKHRTIAEGITRLRIALRTPRQCIRLIGLSGVGKTRLVQALFEPDVGNDALDPSIAIYTDYSTETTPTARDMARELIARGERAILVVDNCNPNTHSELARLCASDGSEVNLITVEYDVRDDEPEQTDVFRLESASRKLVAEWIKQSFPHVSQVDRERIAEFSDGNFRVAGALAQTLRKGDTIGSLKNRDLLERIFRQRNEPDPQLLRAAEDLSLLYSIDGEDISDEGELARLGGISGISARQLYEALAELRQRGVVQARGRFRAILPQAIANTLAAHALERIPAADFDRFCLAVPRRMLKSTSRRLGFLHYSQVAQSTVARWLQARGPLGDLLAMGDVGVQVLTNIAPVAPEAVLSQLECELGQVEPNDRERHKWISLIKALGYDADLFDRAVTLLARFAGSEPENNNLNSARNTFSQFFHLHLSATEATPEQRRSVIKRLAASPDENLRRSADIALRALFQTHFMSAGGHEFGARPRDWGWHPELNRDVWKWFEDAIALVLELTSESDARTLIAEHVRDLWGYPTCRDTLDSLATTFLKNRPWIEGWIAFRATLRFDGEHMSDGVRAKLERLIDRLKPSDLLNRARAVVLNRMPGGGGWDFADGEDYEDHASEAWRKADKMAQEVGRCLAADSEIRAKFLRELFAQPHPMRAFECGLGLAEGADNLGAIWLELATIAPATRDARLLGGFICGAHQRDPAFTSTALEATIDNPELAPVLPYLQTRIGIDAAGIARLRRAIAKGVMVAPNFLNIANGSVSNSPPDELAALLQDIATLSDGVEIALNVLEMYFSSNREDKNERNARLVSAGRDLLIRANFSKNSMLREYGTQNVIIICLTGNDGARAAEKICSNICATLDDYHFSARNLNNIFKTLFETQPFITLDAFLLSPSPHGVRHRFDLDFAIGPSLENIDPATLETWASRDPHTRYPLLGQCLRMFSKRNNDEQNQISPLFLSILGHAPDKRIFLGDAWDRVHPRSWGGSLAHILVQRKAQIVKLAEQGDAQVRAWVDEVTPEIDRWIENDRRRDRAMEESFE